MFVDGIIKARAIDDDFFFEKFSNRKDALILDLQYFFQIKLIKIASCFFPMQFSPDFLRFFFFLFSFSDRKRICARCIVQGLCKGLSLITLHSSSIKMIASINCGVPELYRSTQNIFFAAHKASQRKNKRCSLLSIPLCLPCRLKT